MATKGRTDDARLAPRSAVKEVEEGVMVDLAAVVLSGVFLVFVVGPVAVAGVLIRRSGVGLARQDRRLTASVLGTIVGTWAGLFACLKMDNLGAGGSLTFPIVFVGAAFLGGLVGWCGEEVISKRPVMKQRRASVESLQPTVVREV